MARGANSGMDSLGRHAVASNTYGKQNRRNVQAVRPNPQASLPRNPFGAPQAAGLRNAPPSNSRFTDAGHSAQWSHPNTHLHAANQTSQHQPAPMAQNYQRSSSTVAQSTILSSSQQGFAMPPARIPSRNRQECNDGQQHFNSNSHLHPAHNMDEYDDEDQERTHLPQSSGHTERRPNSFACEATTIPTYIPGPGPNTAPGGYRVSTPGQAPPSTAGTTMSQKDAESIQTHLRRFLRDAGESRRKYEKVANDLAESYEALLEEVGKTSALALRILELQNQMEERLREHIATERGQMTEDMERIFEQKLETLWISKVLPELESLKRAIDRNEDVASRHRSSIETRLTELMLSIENRETHDREKHDKLNEMFEDILTTVRRGYRKDPEDDLRVPPNVEAKLQALESMLQRVLQEGLSRADLPSALHPHTRPEAVQGGPAFAQNETSNGFQAEQSSSTRRNVPPTRGQAPTFATPSPEPEPRNEEHVWSSSDDDAPLVPKRKRQDNDTDPVDPNPISDIAESRSSSLSPVPPSLEVPIKRKRGRPPKPKTAAQLGKNDQAMRQFKAAEDNGEGGPSSTRAEPVQAAADAPPKRKRGRPPKNRTTAQPSDGTTREDLGGAGRGGQRRGSMSNASRRQRDDEEDADFTTRSRGAQAAGGGEASEGQRYTFRQRKQFKYGH